MNWQTIKPKVTRLVMWSIKNHWSWLVVIIGLQYVSGEVIGGDDKYLILMDYSRWLVIHKLNSKLILLMVVGLAAEKGYLWLVRKGKI